MPVSPPQPIASGFISLSQLFKRLTRVTPVEPKLTVGVDIGSTAVKTLALGARKGGGLRPVIGQQVVPLSKGQEADATEAIKAAVSALRLPVRTVNLSVSGPWVIMRVVEVPVMTQAEMKQALPFEAQRFLPFNIQDVVIDGAILGPADAEKRVWLLIVACKKELVERRIDWSLRAGFDVGLIDVDALALVNGFLVKGNGRPGGAMPAMINVGAQLTNLVIFRGSIPYLLRDIPWGGEKLLRAVAEQLQVEATAVASELSQGASRPELLTAMKTACEALVTELQLSFDYFENRFGQPPEQILVTGGWGQSELFVESLKSHLAQTVTPWTPVQGVPAQCAVAYGLALRTSSC